jgi:hypothetical protein
MKALPPWTGGARLRWARWSQVLAAQGKLTALEGGSRSVSRDVRTPASRAWHTTSGSPPSASPDLLGKRKSASLRRSLELRRRGPLLLSGDVQVPTPPPKAPVPITRRGTGARRGHGPATVRRSRRMPRAGVFARPTQVPGVQTRSTAGRRELRLPARRPARLVRLRMPAAVRGREGSVAGRKPSPRGPRWLWSPTRRAEWLVLPGHPGPQSVEFRRPTAGLGRRRSARHTTTAHAVRAGGHNGWF